MSIGSSFCCARETRSRGVPPEACLIRPGSCLATPSDRPRGRRKANVLVTGAGASRSQVMDTLHTPLRGVKGLRAPGILRRD